LTAQTPKTVVARRTNRSIAELDGVDLEVDADGGDERRRECAVCAARCTQQRDVARRTNTRAAGQRD
jgi:hypothetical protein